MEMNIAFYTWILPITTGMTESTELCWGGYYCPGNMSEANPTQYICPRGLHCPNGSAIYRECPDGSYTNYTGAAECVPCPQGFYCLPVQPENATLNAQLCPAGYYCPEGKLYHIIAQPFTAIYYCPEGKLCHTDCTALYCYILLSLRQVMSH